MQQDWWGERRPPPPPHMVSGEAAPKCRPTPTPMKRRPSFVAPIPPDGVRPQPVPGAELGPNGSSAPRPPSFVGPSSIGSYPPRPPAAVTPHGHRHPSALLDHAGTTSSVSAPLYNATMPTFTESSPFSNAVTWDSRSCASTPPTFYNDDDQSPTRTLVFDWSLASTLTDTYDPMSSSQSFMDMLTQESESPLDMLTQDSGKGRGGNYNHNEDIQLCWSWMHITYDARTGNEQPRSTYWNRIAEHYHDNKTFDSERNATSLEVGNYPEGVP
ncbi:hypothetical protein QOZ80_1BG0073910 [Eleusine coracana subsp. coracana]|nr:hypothetical protein QOZ80_1BG0073910 [Eleusine coracana subsp. coracana]